MFSAVFSRCFLRPAFASRKKGDSSQQGELWGISNLLRFSGESMLLKLRAEHGAGLPPLVPDAKVQRQPSVCEPNASPISKQIDATNEPKSR